MFDVVSPPFVRYPLFIRILLMFCMLLFNLGVVSVLSLGIASFLFGLRDMEPVLHGTMDTPAQLYAFLFIQGFSSIGGFVLTALIFSVLEAGEFKYHLRLTRWPSLKFIALAVATVLVSQFFIEFLVEVNKSIPLPQFLHFLYDLQEEAETVTNSLMSFSAPGSFLFVAIVVALIPALAEEFFFRGLLLGDMLKSRVHPAAAIAISGLLFALSHLQYDNIIAIWTLGAFLGFLYYVSGSLWLPVLAHFTNNLLAIVVKYLLHLGVISQEVADAKTPWYLTIVSLALFASLVFLFHKWKKPVVFAEDLETENETP